MNQSESLITLFYLAVFLGVAHTLMSPAHYLPFAALGKANGWSVYRTIFATALCGMGHVISSLMVGSIGIALGASVGAVDTVNASREDIVKWMFLAFGICYMIYGVKIALMQSAGVDTVDGEVRGHSCSHCHHIDIKKNAGFWVLFVLFLFGPCEVLIPLLIEPASKFNWLAVLGVALAFSLTTVVTMMFAVGAVMYGLKFTGTWTGRVERWNHAITGAILVLCAIAMFVFEH